MPVDVDKGGRERMAREVGRDGRTADEVQQQSDANVLCVKGRIEGRRTDVNKARQRPRYAPSGTAISQMDGRRRR
jgi:hypothetical protein